jgi:hypothetical protein
MFRTSLALLLATACMAACFGVARAGDELPIKRAPQPKSSAQLLDGNFAGVQIGYS